MLVPFRVKMRTLNHTKLNRFLPLRHRLQGSVTITTEVGTNSATTLSRMNFSGYVGNVTIFS